MIHDVSIDRYRFCSSDFECFEEFSMKRERIKWLKCELQPRESELMSFEGIERWK